MKNLSRKILSVFMALSLITLCSACGNSADSAIASENTETKDGYRIAMVANTAINDGGWNSACYEAMVGAAKANGFETTYSEKVEQTDYVSVFTNYANMGYHAIFAPGSEFTDAVTEVAANYPDTTFILLNGSVQSENIISILADNYQLGEIAGCLAALQTKTNSVALVGGIEIATADESAKGFQYAVSKINPEIEVSVTWAGTFDDAAKGKEIADSLVTTSNVDVIYGLASIVDSGIREALTAYDSVYNIAQPSDMASTAPDIIMNSVCSSTEEMLSIAMEKVISGEANTIISGDISNGCIFLGEYGNFVSDDVKKEMENYVQQISDGSF